MPSHAKIYLSIIIYIYNIYTLDHSLKNWFTVQEDLNIRFWNLWVWFRILKVYIFQSHQFVKTKSYLIIFGKCRPPIN